MKTSTAFAFSQLALFVSLISARGADDLPKSPLFDRYQPMMERSPFAVATAAAPPPQTPNFAKDLFIANAAKLSDEGVVTLNSGTDRNLKEYLSTKGPNKSGYSVSNIEWSDRVGATKVTISKDGQFATLTFNQALLSQPTGGVISTPMAPTINPMPQPISQPPGGVAPNNPYNVNNAIKPAPIPTLPTPPPRVRGVIQRNPVATPAQQPNAGVVPDEQ